jgi:diguanylate cyclase (GGDEF)-like protein
LHSGLKRHPHDSFLKKVEIFSLLSLDEVSSFSALLTERYLPMNSTICREGESGNSLFIVRRGKVRVTINLSGGGVDEVAVFSRGDFFGEMSIIENAPRSASCSCVTDVHLLELSEPDFYRLLEEKPDLAIKVMYRMLNIVTNRLMDRSEFLSDMVLWGETASKRAVLDVLTGLYNRRFIDDALENLFSRVSAKKDSFAFLMIDLDYFREINEEKGNPVGDEIIKTVGETLTTIFTDKQIAARYGGDEFAVLLPNTNLDEAEKLAESVRGTIEKINFTDPEIKMTASIGLAVFPTHGMDQTKLCEAADSALYISKEKGRNCVSFQPIARGV